MDKGLIPVKEPQVLVFSSRYSLVPKSIEMTIDRSGQLQADTQPDRNESCSSRLQAPLFPPVLRRKLQHRRMLS